MKKAAGTHYVFPDNVVQVLNERTNMVHLSPGEGVACNAWKCGSAKVPSKGAIFAASTTRWSPAKNPFTLCLGCYSVRCLGRLGGKLKVEDKEIELASAVPSSSSSSFQVQAHPLDDCALIWVFPLFRLRPTACGLVSRRRLLDMRWSALPYSVWTWFPS